MPEASMLDPHIRPVQLRYDLNQIADLIEICFGPYLDAEGKDYVRHIRRAPRDYDRFILDNSTPESSFLPFHGYVWVEGKKIIGNLTLILIRRKMKHAYFIANVAVHPDFRGQGIARKLTDTAIAHVVQHGGRTIYLQVRSENEIAQKLYLTHGFAEMTRRTQWIFRPGQEYNAQPLPAISIRRRKRSDWNQQLDWLKDVYPPEIAWNLPTNFTKLEPGFLNCLDQLFNGSINRTWVAYQDEKMIGTGTLVQRGEPSDYLWLGTSPVWEDLSILSLLPVVQQHMLTPHKLTVNYPAGRGLDAFKKVGMVELNTLIWMKRAIEANNL
jgi:ribosomal protein S18 acetylase RimI-like enzyme